LSAVGQECFLANSFWEQRTVADGTRDDLR
jgi:hypothetical protein